MLLSSFSERPVPHHHWPSPTTECLINIEPSFKNSYNCPSSKRPTPCTLIGRCTSCLKCWTFTFPWILYELQSFHGHPVIFTSVISVPTTLAEGFKEVSRVRWWLDGSQCEGLALEPQATDKWTALILLPVQVLAWAWLVPADTAT